jgi:hypothetical protein
MASKVLNKVLRRVVVDGEPRKAPRQPAGEDRAQFHGEKRCPRADGREDGPGEDAGPRPELDNGLSVLEGATTQHRRGKPPRAGSQRPHRSRAAEKRAQKADVVLDPGLQLAQEPFRPPTLARFVPTTAPPK